MPVMVQYQPGFSFGLLKHTTQLGHLQYDLTFGLLAAHALMVQYKPAVSFGLLKAYSIVGPYVAQT